MSSRHRLLKKFLRKPLSTRLPLRQPKRLRKKNLHDALAARRNQSLKKAKKTFRQTALLQLFSRDRLLQKVGVFCRSISPNPLSHRAFQKNCSGAIFWANLLSESFSTAQQVRFKTLFLEIFAMRFSAFAVLTACVGTLLLTGCAPTRYKLDMTQYEHYRTEPGKPRISIRG